ncbi:MAG: hypothetical protein AB7N71_05745 [Phycisphaerae bacterium]
MKFRAFSAVCAFAACTLSPAFAQPDAITGEKLPEHLKGNGEVFSWYDAAAQDLLAPPQIVDPKARGANLHGEWEVPSPRSQTYPSSGTQSLINKNGDLQMGIGFPGGATVHGVYVSGVDQLAGSASGLQAVGYRDGVEVARSEWLFEIAAEPTWMLLDFANVDRVIFTACAKIKEGGWYALDDLTFTRNADDDVTVIDFEELPVKEPLTGSNYAGLVWEVGGGEYGVDNGIHAPISNEIYTGEESESDGSESVALGGSIGTLTLDLEFEGIRRFESATSYPPDTHGAVGINHYVEAVNSRIAIFDKSNGVRISSQSLSSFLAGGSGDPRVLFDQHSNRWVVMDTDFSSRIYFAVSRTEDPTGNWFRTNFVVSSGVDSGSWPDHPTMGVDINGIYMAYWAVNGTGMAIIAIDKAPLIAASPSLGTVTFFRSLPFEGSIQPCHTYGNPGGEYCVSRFNNNGMRIRRVNPPLTNPTLTQPGIVTVAGYASAPDAPAMGSSIPLDTVDTRLWNAVYRDGSIWTTHTINVGGRAACRWYQLNTAPVGLVQQGTISDPVRALFFPTIAVNGNGDAVMGFSGVRSSEFAGVYYSGRVSFDPAGFMTTPVLYQEGLSAINNIDNANRNRWGDYSNTVVDPVDDQTFWTIQTYASTGGAWGTRVAVLTFGDCNNNGIPDECDIDCGSCGLPGCGQSSDCNGNLIPDECEPDCNNNGIPDECDITSGFSLDCNGNGIPDSCDLLEGDSLDCNSNSIPDECDIAGGLELDCNGNGVPDSCDLSSGFSLDCNGNNIPDECDMAGGADPDCNGNGIPDSCDLASESSFDCNSNLVPDECDIERLAELSSPQFSPFGNGFPATHTFANPPTPLSDVNLEVQSIGDFNFSSELVSVTFNGMPMGNIFVSGADCPPDPIADQIIIPRDDFNNSVAANSGNAMIDLLPSSGVDATLCTEPPTYAQIFLRFQDGVVGSADLNENGIPDECEKVNLLGDMNCDGVVSVSDIGGFVLALTDPAGYAAQFPNCDINNADVNQDLSISVSDIGPFVALLTQ